MTSSADSRPSEDWLRRVRDYASHVMPDVVFGRAGPEVTPLDAGENHLVYKVSGTSTDTSAAVVVRVATSARASDCLIAGHEAAVLQRVQGVAAPRLHDFRCESDWFDTPVMCLGYVSGEQRPPQTHHDFERLGAVVAALHALPVEGLSSGTGTLQTYLQARVEKMTGRRAVLRDPIPSASQDRFARALGQAEHVAEQASRAESFRDSSGDLVLLHGDVAGGNIVWTPHPVLIDWEYARVGDAADEIAYVFAQHDCTPGQRTSFWRGYQPRNGSLSRAVVDRAQHWEPITVLGSALFWVELWFRRLSADESEAVDPSATKQPAYYEDHALRRLRRFDALLDARGR